MNTVTVTPITSNCNAQAVQVPSEEVPVFNLKGEHPHSSEWEMKSGIKVRCLAVGQEGRGRWLSRVVVEHRGQMPQVGPEVPYASEPWSDSEKTPERLAAFKAYREYEARKKAADDASVLFSASIQATRQGAVKLVSVIGKKVQQADGCVLVADLGMGFRGGNGMTGDITGREEYEEWGEKKQRNTFGPMPGVVLAEGTIAQGDAGRMGGGTQRIFYLPKGQVLRCYRTGRLYGAPASHYYLFDGQKLWCMTYDERVAAESVFQNPFPRPPALPLPVGLVVNTGDSTDLP